MKKTHTPNTFITAIFRDGMTYINGGKYLAGSFAVKLLNRYYVKDSASRISAWLIDNWIIRKQLATGYILKDDFIKTGQSIQKVYETLEKVEPFNLLDLEKEKKRTENLFTEVNADTIEKYFADRALIATADFGGKYYETFWNDISKDEHKKAADLVGEVMDTLDFYDSISDGLTDAFDGLRRFIADQDEADRLDEEHLLPIALENLPPEINGNIEYTAVHRKKRETIARRISFRDFYGFIIADFYEGLHYGHYPRRCEVCGKYFLMTNARKQKYCNGYSKYTDRNGHKIPCRKYAAISSEYVTELAKNDSVAAIFTSRMNYIRQNKSRGVITAEEAYEAKEYVWDCRDNFDMDNDYTFEQYKRDLEPGGFFVRVKEFASRRIG